MALRIPTSGLRKELWRARILGYYWKNYLLTGERELSMLATLVDPRRLAIDIGANAGVYTYHLARFARDVMTFEPNPEYVELIKAMGLKTRVEAVALSSKPGTAALRFPSIDGQENSGMASLDLNVPDSAISREIEVPLKRLDDYDLKDVGFIKIDVEGHEEAVLAGAVETIRRNKPALLVEIEERSNLGGLERISRNLAEAGYAGSFIDRGRQRPLAEFKVAEHQVWSHDVGRRKINRRKLHYVNNFIFRQA